MNCKSFIELNPVEKVILVGKIIHLISEYESAFEVAKKLIENADEAGIFDDVKFMPTNGLAPRDIP